MKSRISLTPFALALCLGTGLFAQEAQQAPPEVAEINAAMALADAPERAKELKRIRAAYPESRYANTLDSLLLDAVTASADSLDQILAGHKEIIGQAKLPALFAMNANAASMIINHSKVGDFSAAAVLKAVQEYRDQGTQLLSNPEFLETIPENRREQVINSYKNAFEIPFARAQAMAGNGEAAMNTLEEYKKAGALNANYNLALGETLSALKRDKEALEAFLSAATEGLAVATDKARASYAKEKGSEAGFDALLTSRKTQLPFHPPPFKAPENWQGKAVLAELFTGSECPPCVAADFAFDGFIESYPSKHLVVLEYHLPIPRYDPMMNPATKKREDYYGRAIIGGTPTCIIDGVKPIGAGGGRSNSEGSFNRLKEGIDPLLGEPTPVTIKATATLSGGDVKVDCEFSAVVEGSDYNIVLVQGVQEFAGGNGIILHKMVVRDIETVSPAAKASVTFNIPKSEKATEEYLAEYGKRIPEGATNGSWPFKQNIIDSKNLKAVVFVQDKESKQVHNAFVVDVK